jgi:hypothetical protein
MASLRAALKRALPPGGYEAVRNGWWRAGFYFPRMVASWFVKRRPEILASAGAGGSLTTQLRNVNALAPTEMCLVMTKYGSDKGFRLHNYTPVYSAMLHLRQGQPLRIFELGLGTNDPQAPSTMGINARPGASLRGWRELFPQASIYGADIDRSILFREDRISTFYCDQCDPAAIQELWSQPELREGMDFIIEDGLHTFEANVSFLEGSLQRLRPGGVYVVEDVAEATIAKWRERLHETYAKLHEYEFVLVKLPHASERHNNLLIVRRTPESGLSRSVGLAAAPPSGATH